MMQDNNTLSLRLLCADLGYKLRRLPSIFELDIVKKTICSYAEYNSKEYKDKFEEWSQSVFGEIPDLDNVTVFSEMYQIASYLLKVKRAPTAQQKDDYIDSFLSIEHENSNYRVNTKSNTLRLARIVIRRLTSDLDLSFSNVAKFCRHGPGACTERFVNRDKDYAIYKDFKQLRGFVPRDWMFSTYSSFLDYHQHSHYDNVEDRIKAKLALVPKTWKGPRGVFVSPASAVFLQIGIDGAIKNWIRRTCLINCWNPASQSLNQEAAYVGSYDRSWATIDLKDASDRITKQLVRYLFHRRDWIALASTRPSTVLLPNGMEHKMSMLSPMGDGKTFAVLSLVCIGLSIASILDADGILASDHIHMDMISRAVSRVRVFGDDIAIHSIYYTNICRTLREAGLVVNTTKSYVHGAFRESCGVDAYNGKDITPIRLKTDLNKCTRHDLSSLIEMHNRVYYKHPDWCRVRYHLESVIHRLDPHVAYAHSFKECPQLLWEPDRRLVIYRNLRKKLRMGLRNGYPSVLSTHEAVAQTGYRFQSSDWYHYNISMFPEYTLTECQGDFLLSSSDDLNVDIQKYFDCHRTARPMNWFGCGPDWAHTTKI